MTAFTILEVSRRTGLSEPTLRYYEQVGLVGPVARDTSSGHRRYQQSDIDDLDVLACLRTMGMGIADMRTYQANRRLGHARAGEQRDILLRHAEQVREQVTRLEVHLDYLRAKAQLWAARETGDPDAEAAARADVDAVVPQLERTMGGVAGGLRAT